MRSDVTNEERVRLIRSGIDPVAHMEQLYEQNRGAFAGMAARYRGMAEFEDLMQEGYFGLCRAVESFEEERGTAFFTYALYWVRQAMQRLAANSRKHCLLSLDAALPERNEAGWGVWLPEKENVCELVLDRMRQEELKAAVWPLVDRLEERQARTLYLRYRDGKTRKETGEALGCSQSQARGLEEKALCELRRPRYAKRLRPCLYEELYNRGMQGTGVKRFRQTWTSATERLAIQEAEKKNGVGV